MWVPMGHPETNPLTHGGIAFHEARPWCQEGWGLLLYGTKVQGEGKVILYFGKRVVITFQKI